MQLTKFTDFSLRALMLLASKPGEKQTISGVSETLQVSRNHMVKVVNKLATRGYINTTRGHQGGFVLARDPADISLGQVVRDVEANLNMVDCATPPCPMIKGCRLVSILGGGREAFLAHLDGYTLADLVDSNPDLMKSLV